MKHTFKDAYGVLHQHAQTLRNQTEPNIDDLLTIVTESVAAYKVCQTRIDAVEKALEKALSHAQDATAGQDERPPADADDDLPF
jgi:exodeoxyribonuclease VII small subunit